MEKIVFLGMMLVAGVSLQQISPFGRSESVGLAAVPVDNRHNGIDTLKLDRETNLVIDERLNLVKAHCTACHSTKLITQSQLTRDGWRQKIRWMQRTQKLWDLGESEPIVLDYLTKYYGPSDRAFDGRRLPLPKQTWH